MAVYFIREVGTVYVKVGHSADVDARMRSLQTGSSAQLQLELAVESPKQTDVELERQLHTVLQQQHHRGEWFDLPSEKLQGFMQTPQWRHLRVTHGSLHVLAFERWLSIQTTFALDMKLKHTLLHFDVSEEQPATHKSLLNLSRLSYLLQEYHDYLQEYDLDDFGGLRCATYRKLRVVHKQLKCVVMEIDTRVEETFDKYVDSFIGAFDNFDESVGHV
jgi:hypothetical protein